VNQSSPAARIRQRLERLYGDRAGESVDQLFSLLDRWREPLALRPRPPGLSEADAVLITYGDMVRRPREAPLATLGRFCGARLSQSFSIVHVLPFFPSSSDDGFSVIDYRTVDERLGTWDDVESLAGRFDLMFDLVLNHTSAQGEWFGQFLRNEPPGRDYVLCAAPDADLDAVVRPRSHPLLTPVETALGERHVWTTFSADQVDLDFDRCEVLLEFVDILLQYAAKGARIIRLDAVAFLFKQAGTPCVHLPRTHEAVKLLRDVLDAAAPGTLLLTETNVPHQENAAYFGEGDEAHLIYQFCLPPLLLHALTTGDARPLTRWAAGLEEAPPGCTFLNFTASHDGIGLRPLEGLVPPGGREALVQRVQRNGGLVSQRRGPDGVEVPYELNITYFDALADGPGDVTDAQVRRFVTSQTVALALQGIPALYFHSLTATRNHTDGVAETGRARTINRRKWDVDELARRLDDPATVAHRVFGELTHRLRIRAGQPAFAPERSQRVLDLDPRLFAVQRGRDERAVICLHNVSAESVAVASARLPGSVRIWHDILTGKETRGRDVTVPPFEAAWLTARRS